jgi:uncharacterized protein (DUF488 family)
MAELVDAGVELVIDVRAVPVSRKPGFAKTRLGAWLDGNNIAYLHLKGLGTPKEGREAAKAGRMDEFRAIFDQHMSSDQAQADLAEARRLCHDRGVCLLCCEADPTNCHRTIVAETLAQADAFTIHHLRPYARGDLLETS